jgi:FkbM family methyltransferase
MLENVIPRLLGWVPISWRRAIIGSPDRPSRVATLAHNLLNRMPPAESQVFDCQGALAGYRMSIDWNRFRSFVYGTWEPQVISAVSGIVKPGMTIIDIGAHIGYYTLLFAKRVGPNGRVLAFEPLPANFELLKRNIQLNGVPYVQAFPQAIFSRNEEIILTVPDDLPHSGDASVCHGRGRKEFRVPAITLDAFCDSRGLRPHILKMDVEGAEHDVLQGAAETIARCHPILLIELHHFDGNLAAHPVPKFLGNWGYRIQWIERSEMTSHILATPGSAESVANRPRADGEHGER